MLFFSQRKISEMRGPTGVKFCTMVSTRPYFMMLVQNVGGGTPKKFQGLKTCKIWPDFGRLRSSAANISETDEDIQNLIVIPSIAIPPALDKTSLVKFGSTTYEFDHKYLWTGLRYRQAVNGVIKYGQFHVERNKFCKLRSSTNQVISAHVDLP